MSGQHKVSQPFLKDTISFHLLHPGEPEDRVQGELQVRGAGEVASQPGGHHAAAGRGILEVNSTISP